MAEYESYPLWDSYEGLHNVDPFDLPIPGVLANAVTEWSDEYTATLNRSEPLASGFADVASGGAWLRAGAAIANRLREHDVAVMVCPSRAPQQRR
jgi:hypothetical protein